MSHLLVNFNYLLIIVLLLLCLPFCLPAIQALNYSMTYKLHPSSFLATLCFNLSAVIILSFFLPLFVPSHFKEFTCKPLGFSPPLLKLIPIELLNCHPGNKEPCLVGVCQDRCEAGFNMTWQEGEQEGGWEKLEGKESSELEVGKENIC